jgi:hypothetical protein
MITVIWRVLRQALGLGHPSTGSDLSGCQMELGAQSARRGLFA